MGCGRGNKSFYIALHLKDVQGFVIAVNLDAKLISTAKSLSKHLDIDQAIDLI